MLPVAARFSWCLQSSTYGSDFSIRENSLHKIHSLPQSPNFYTVQLSIETTSKLNLTNVSTALITGLSMKSALYDMVFSMFIFIVYIACHQCTSYTKWQEIILNYAIFNLNL